jgi:hypothetical protein
MASILHTRLFDCPPHRRRHAGLLAITLIALFLLVAMPSLGAAQAGRIDSASERSVKAAFIYKFPSYVEWPAEATPASGAAFVIGVIGADNIAADLQRITAGRTIDNRPIQVRTMKESDSLNGIQVLYIGNAEALVLRKLLKDAQQRSILTITDTEGALSAGSVINFRIADNRVRFEVSFDTAEKSNLKLSSRLIAVAYYVQQASP